MIKALATVLALLPVAVYGDIIAARYSGETTRYMHGVFGRGFEYSTLEITSSDGSVTRIVLPENRVFEDTTPRLADMDGDGDNEVIVVETDVDLGAQLAIYDLNGKRAATPFIGRTHRWLAPVGTADFDGDGAQDVAYVETPHLGKTLKFWSLKGNVLHQIGEAIGLTNHRFGMGKISGGVRVCDGVAKAITVSADWQFIVATGLVNGVPEFTTVGPFKGEKSMADALVCK
ncbi:MAG: VCBS repeat-containing protein [Paracoccaceae bacterium]